MHSIFLFLTSDESSASFTANSQAQSQRGNDQIPQDTGATNSQPAGNYIYSTRAPYTASSDPKANADGPDYLEVIGDDDDVHTNNTETSGGKSHEICLVENNRNLLTQSGYMQPLDISDNNTNVETSEGKYQEIHLKEHKKNLSTQSRYMQTLDIPENNKHVETEENTYDEIASTYDTFPSNTRQTKKIVICISILTLVVTIAVGVAVFILMNKNKGKYTILHKLKRTEKEKEGAHF